MGAWNNFHASIIDIAFIDGHPGCAGCQGSNRPVVPILMHRHLHPVSTRFAEELTPPEDDIRTNQLFHTVKDLGMICQFKKNPIPPDSFIIQSINMNTDQLLRSDP